MSTKVSPVGVGGMRKLARAGPLGGWCFLPRKAIPPHAPALSPQVTVGWVETRLVTRTKERDPAARLRGLVTPGAAMKLNQVIPRAGPPSGASLQREYAWAATRWGTRPGARAL